ncbi:MAG: hypothetical protein D6784_01280 [Chloroflexi bacterium]|nr:MAG: hypothetical protein D6784_01280 [Chloroflexota bacterium]
MAKKYPVWVVLVVGLLMFGVPATGQAQSSAAENFVFVNYIGRELVLDLDDVTYLVPGTDTHPEGGRLSLQLAVGPHKFAANVPGVPTGAAGEFTIEPDGLVAKAAVISRTPIPLDRNGIVIGQAEDFVDVFDFDPFTRPAPAPSPVDTWTPALPAPGMGSLVWMNHVGRDEVTIDIAGQLYKVPAQTGSIPGRLQIDLPPGLYTYTASVPNGSLNGNIAVTAGQVTGLHLTATLPEPETYEIGDKFKFLPPVTLQVAAETLTPVAGPQPAESAPAVLPATGGQVDTLLPSPNPAPEGVRVMNFTGDTLTFTINNQTFLVPPQSDRLVAVPAGQFSYTASLPAVAVGGTVTVVSGQTVELSVVINVAHDALAVYLP